MLKVERLTKTFGSLVAVDNLSFSVPKGQIQPQNTRPKTSVSATITSDQARPR